MLQNIRDNSKGIIAKILVGFIVLTFALFGVESIISLASGSGAPVVVNGEDISELEVRQSIDQQRQIMAQRMGENFDASAFDDNFFRNIAIEQLIDRKLQLQWAEKNDFTYPESGIFEMITQAPGFQVDGKFDKDIYLDMVSRRGYTPTTFNQFLREEQMITQVRAGIAATGFTTQKELELIAQLEAEKRSFDYFQISVDDVKASVEVNEEDALAFYDENQDNYQSDEMVQVEYLVLTSDKLSKDQDVEEGDIKLAYDEEVSELKSSQERQIAHILISESDTLTSEQAKAKAQDLKDQIDAGADFASLAREHSTDSFSSAAGGDLGMVTKDIFDDESFVEAAFTLPVGNVSEVVESQDGFHIIKVVDETSVEIPSFEERKVKLAEELALKKAQDALLVATEELKNIAFSAPDLSEPAEEFGLELQTSPFFGRNGVEGENVLFQNRNVINSAFDESVLVEGNNSDVIEIDENQVIVLRVKDHKSAEIQEFEAVKEQVMKTVLANMAKEHALEKAKTLIGEFSGSQATTNHSVEWTSVVDGDRKGTQASFQVVQKVFAMPKPEADKSLLDHVVLPNGDVAVVRLNAVNPGKISDLEEQQLTMMKQRIETIQGNSDYSNYSGQLKELAEIKKI